MDVAEVDDKELKLANALYAASIAESEDDKVMKMLGEAKKLVQRLVLEKDDEAQLTKRQIVEIGQELADTKKYAECATTRADVAESECAKLKRMLVEEGKTVQRLTLEKNEEAELAKRLLEKIFQELANARKEAQFSQKNADIAKDECIKLKGELKEKEQSISDLKLQIVDTREVTMRQVKDITQILEDAQREVEYAQYDADIAKNELIEAKKELQEKTELVQLLKLECQRTSKSAVRHAKDCAICLNNEKDTAFGCGHMTCEECGIMLTTCPICRVEITHRIKLFPG